MKIGLGSYYLDRYGLEEGARRMAEDGYKAVDYPLADTNGELFLARDDELMVKIMHIKKTLNAAGLTVEQIHGPWHYPEYTMDGDRAERFEKMTKALVIGWHLGAKYMAIHPLMPFGVSGDGTTEELRAINKQFFAALANVAQKLGMYVCLENMPFVDFALSTVEQIADFVREVNHPALKMCFDVGHANIFGGRIGEKVRYASDLIKIIHVHDNMGDRDNHLIPYEGCVDFADFAEALFDIGYDGIFNLETEPVSKKQAENGMSVDEIRAMEKRFADIARLLAG